MKIVKLTIGALLLFVLLNTVNAQTSLELDESKSVQVICPNKVDKRILSFDPIQDRWCDTRLGDFCKHRQLDAARRVCKKQYAVALKKLQIDSDYTVKPTEIMDVSSELSSLRLPLDDSSQKDRELENELLDIEEKRLDVKRKMLALEKREMILRASLYSLE